MLFLPLRLNVTAGLLAYNSIATDNLVYINIHTTCHIHYFLVSHTFINFLFILDITTQQYARNKYPLFIAQNILL